MWKLHQIQLSTKLRQDAAVYVYKQVNTHTHYNDTNIIKISVEMHEKAFAN